MPKKPSLVEKILDRFRAKPGRWIPGGSVERWVTTYTDYTASNARRRLRELVEAGVLQQDERTIDRVNHAFYCYDPDTTAAPKTTYSYEYDRERNCMVEKRITA